MDVARSSSPVTGLLLHTTSCFPSKARRFPRFCRDKSSFMNKTHLYRWLLYSSYYVLCSPMPHSSSFSACVFFWLLYWQIAWECSFSKSMLLLVRAPLQYVLVEKMSKHVIKLCHFLLFFISVFHIALLEMTQRGKNVSRDSSQSDHADLWTHPITPSRLYLSKRKRKCSEFFCVLKSRLITGKDSGQWSVTFIFSYLCFLSDTKHKPLYYLLLSLSLFGVIPIPFK